MQRLITTGYVIAGALAGQFVGTMLAFLLLRSTGTLDDERTYVLVVGTGAAASTLAGGVFGWRVRHTRTRPAAGHPGEQPQPGDRRLSSAAGSGACFGLLATAVGALVFVISLSVADPSPAYGIGTVIGGGLIVGLIGAVLASPTGAGLGALFGLLNGAIARRTWGQGWPAVVAAASLIFLPVLILVASQDGDLSNNAVFVLGFGLVPALASAAHLRYEQRRLRQSSTSARPLEPS